MSLKQREYSVQTPVCQPSQPRLVDSLLAVIAPWRCVLCHAAGAGQDLCAGCLADLPRLSVGCLRCALPLPADVSMCGRCLRQAGAVDFTVAALVYEYPVDRLIAGLKFQNKLCMVPLLAQLLLERLCTAAIAPKLGQPHLLMAVPLHARRLARRGFNQADEIASRVARGLRLAPPGHPVVRTSATPHQTGLSRSARLRNLRGAFQLRESVANLHVVIIDDVITTGTTVNELAQVLKRGGASRVDVWAVARTP